MIYSAVIVGEGLSGLSSAWHLQRSLTLQGTKAKEYRILIVEARDRVGGRLHSERNIDLGAAWSWIGNDRALQDLAAAVNASTQAQQSKGKTLTQTQHGNVSVYGSNMSPSGEGSVRFVESAASIPKKLLTLLDVKLFEVRLNCEVSTIQETDDDNLVDVAITTASGDIITVQSRVVIVALPPKLAATSIHFEPVLPFTKKEAMLHTPTWMEHTGKIGFLYNSDFWRTKGLSGTAFSEKGPLRQVWDNSYVDTNDQPVHALAGFVFDEDLLYLTDEETIRKSPILLQMGTLFGPDALEPTHIVYKSWSHDPFTALAHDSIGLELPFGNPQVRLRMGKKQQIIFAGTETAPNEHGHMNGAVVAGYRAAEEALECFHQFDTT